MPSEIEDYDKRGKLMLYGDQRVFVSVRKDRESNWCRKYQGWGISEDIIDSLKLHQCDLIVLMIGSDGDVASIDFSEFLDKAKRDQLGPSDPQYFVADKEFSHEEQP